jgi:hypothetical protein
VRANAEQFGDSLKCAGGLKHHAAGVVVGEALSEVIEQEGRAFHRDKVDVPEAAGGELRSQLARPVEVAAKRS